MKIINLGLVLALTAAAWASPGFAQRRIFQNKKEEKKEERGENANKRFALAAVKYRNGKLDAAVEILKKNLEEYPEHFHSVALMAKIAYDKHDFAHALPLTLHALALRPSNRAMNTLAASICQKTGKSLRAYEFLNRAGKSSDQDENGEVKFNENDNSDLQKTISASLKTHRGSSPTFYTSKDAGQAGQDILASVPKVDDGKKLRVVVFAFEAKGNDSSGLGSAVGEMVTTAMVQTNCFQVVERQQLDKILKEQDFELNDAVDQATAVKVGELIGVDAIVVGSILTLGAQTELDSRIVHVQSGQILSAANSTFDSDPQIRNAVNALTVSLTKTVYK